MNQYVEEFTKLAEGSFSEYRKLKKELDSAEAELKRINKQLLDPGMGAPLLKAQKDVAAQKVFEAQNKLRRYKWDGVHRYEKAKAIMREYAKSLEDKFVVNPEQLVPATIKLMESGILKPNDYIHLFETAKQNGNITMMRLIANNASEYSRRERVHGDEAARLRTMENEARDMIGGERLNVFSGAVSAFQRRMSEPMLIDTDTWDTMVQPALESLDD